VIGEIRAAAPQEGGARATLTTEYQIDQYAAGGDREVRVHLGVTVTGLRAPAPGRAPHRSEIIIIDCSGSMRHPTLLKMAAARTAAAAAIDLLPDGTHFALVTGNDTAEVAYPPPVAGHPATVAADPATRAGGSQEALGMNGHGGTRISAWLDLARRLLNDRPDATLRHALLLTDGQDRHDEEGELRRVLDACEGEFSCDALAIGEDWDPDQLREITGRLNGRMGAVEPFGQGAAESDERAVREQLTDMFTELVRASTSRMLPQLTVRVRTEPYLAVTRFQQLYPTERDLTGAASPASPAGGGPADLPTVAVDFPTGAWGDDTRWYELRLRADPGDPRYAAARAAPRARIATIGLAAPGLALPAERAVTVRWTDVLPPATRQGPLAEHIDRATELKEARSRGFRALAAGDRATAERELDTAVRLARRLPDAKALKRLRHLVTEDPVTGRVRLHDDPDPAHLLRGIAESGYLTPPADHLPASADSEERALICPRCEELVPPGRYCVPCGHELEGS
jgi:hypothetical protein